VQSLLFRARFNLYSSPQIVGRCTIINVYNIHRTSIYSRENEHCNEIINIYYICAFGTFIGLYLVYREPIGHKSAYIAYIYIYSMIYNDNNNDMERVAGS